MEYERFIIETADGEVDVPRTDLISLEVELDSELASMFRLRLAIRQQRDGTWTYLDEERFRIWKPITITAGFDTGAETLISGYITHVRPAFDPDPAQCTLEIWGMDGSVLMDREEKLFAWPNAKDSDIAAQIFNRYGFSSLPEDPKFIEDTEVTHEEEVSTILQRETDMQFLKRLALRNGFECYVEGTRGYFRKPQVGTNPQPVLAVHFGEETNVNRLSIEVNALTPANVTMFQVDLTSKGVPQAAATNGQQSVDQTSKGVLLAEATTSQQPALGATRSFVPAGMAQGQMYISMNVTTGYREMAALCQGLFHEAEWFVTAEGEIAGNQYGHVLKPRGTVTIKGVGETYSGIYYVTHVTHTFTSSGYTQSFRAKRNALMPTGKENFAASSARLDGLG
jgi:phage protein D